MNNKLILFYDHFSKEDVEQFKAIIQFYSAQLSAELMDYEYPTVFELLEKDSASLDPVISDASVCLFFLNHLNDQNEHFKQNLTQLTESIINQHILLLPITCSKNVDINQFPESVQQLHSLCIQDSRFSEKILQVLENESDLYQKMTGEVKRIAQADLDGNLCHCTAKELFLYAIGMLRGIGIEENTDKAFSLLSALIGNDAFIPGSIILKNENGSFFHFCNELNHYITASSKQILASEDYRDVQKLLDYCELLHSLSTKYLFNYKTDESLSWIKKILLQYFPDDLSMKSRHWLLNYYWMEAERNADTRYYAKMLNALYSAAIIAAETYTRYQDSVSILYLYKITLILQSYQSRKNSLYEEVKQYEILDEIEPDGTFRPRFKKLPRKKIEIHKIQAFENTYLHHAESISLLINALHKKLSKTAYIAELNISLLSTAELLIRCRFNQIDDEISEWYKENQELILNSFSSSAKQQTWLTMSLYQCSVFLQELRNSAYRSSSEALIGAALYLIELFDRASAYFESIGLDKSESYSVLVTEYEKLKHYRQSDEYALKLFRLVAKRDRNNINRIKSMLNDVYHYASERKKAGMQEQYEKYIRLGMNICQSIRAVPYQYYDAFIEQFRSFRFVAENSLPTPEKMQEFRKRIPTDEKEVNQAHYLAYREIYELLKYIEEEDVALISDEFICMIRSYMNLDYDFQYPEGVEFEDVPLLRATKAVLAYISVHFWGADPPED